MEAFKHLTVKEAKDLIAKDDANIVDIRKPQAFEEGHIQHAKLINDSNIEIFLQEADKNKPLICYCYHGISSQNAAEFFIAQGFKDVYSLDGGYEQWRQAHEST